MTSSASLAFIVIGIGTAGIGHRARRRRIRAPGRDRVIDNRVAGSQEPLCIVEGVITTGASVDVNMDA